MSNPPAAKAERLDSIDCLRGLVIVLMALDHTRDFFGAFIWGGAENAALAPPAVFFTRWITHFCAPTFVLLAGMGAFLSQVRGLSKPRLAGFLLSRGLWLVVLELTVVHFGWMWDWNLRQGMWQVIWAIGWSMVGLSILVWLPAWLIGLFGCAIIVGHNYFDGLTGQKIVTDTHWLAYLVGENGWFWDLLHNTRGFSPSEGYGYFNMYPLLPWFGVMCAGYGLGRVMTMAKPARNRTLLILGLAAIAGFIGLRYLNGYGDPVHWYRIPRSDQPINALRTTMSFLACTKYPPSLLYLLMTIGPALIILVLLDWPIPFFKKFFLTYGRVPLFFYVIHLPAINGLARLIAWYHGSSSSSNFMNLQQHSFDLPNVYLIWALIVLSLYFPCLGYGWLKKRYGGLLKYL